MSERDVFPFEMSRFRAIDRDVDRILDGKEPVEGGHEDLRLLVRELQRAYPVDPVPEDTERDHLAAMMRAARLDLDVGEPVARPGTKAADSAEPASRLPRRRRPMLSELFASLAVKVAAVALAGFTALGGVAGAGVLPDPVQSAAADVAAYVGVELPNPEEAPEAKGPPTEKPEESSMPEDLTLPDEARVPSSLPGPDETGVPDHVTLPEKANVPTTVPVRAGGPESTPAPGGGAAASGKPAVPDHVTLPEEANVPTTVPVQAPPVETGVLSGPPIEQDQPLGKANVPTETPGKGR